LALTESAQFSALGQLLYYEVVYTGIMPLQSFKWQHDNQLRLTHQLGNIAELQMMKEEIYGRTW